MAGTEVAARHEWERRAFERPWVAGGDSVLATFLPVETTDLTTHARQIVGASMQWDCVGSVDSASRYCGQSMWSPNPAVPGVTWVPEEDLRIIAG